MGTDWTTLGEGFTDITMCRNGLIWATNGETVSFRAGIIDEVNNQGSSWEVVGDLAATSINCGYRARLWATTAAGAVMMRENVNNRNWKGDGWRTIAGPEEVRMTQITAGLDGHVHAVGHDGQVYMRMGCTDDMPEGNAWSALTVSQGKFRQVSRGVCQTFAINLHHEIMRRTDCSEEFPSGRDWEQVGGQLMWIAVGHGPVLWGVDYGHDVWFK
jgi:hypothetical protein